MKTRKNIIYGARNNESKYDIIIDETINSVLETFISWIMTSLLNAENFLLEQNIRWNNPDT